MKKLLIIYWLFILASPLTAQDDLESMFGDDESTDYALATFKSTRVILGESVKQASAGNLIFDIQHQFGALNSGFYNFYGLDQATIRLGFLYGVTDWLTLGIGRATLNKAFDGSLKLKILRQSSGKRVMPLSLSWFANTGIEGTEFNRTDIPNYFTNRMSFTHQLLLARKFSSKLSMQLTPTFIHYNLVEKAGESNDLYALGFGGRMKINNRLSVNGEYFLVLNKPGSSPYHNSLSLSLDIETGGHIFQIFLSNSYGMLPQQFITQTEGRWLNGDIHIGFNLSRTFVVRKVQ